MCKCGCVYVWVFNVCLCVGFVICGCVCVFLCFGLRMYGFCNVGCVYVWVCACLVFVGTACVYVRFYGVNCLLCEIFILWMFVCVGL